MAQAGPNIEDVDDAILGLFNAAWQANAGAANANFGSKVPPVEWPNVPPDGPKLDTSNAPWARVSVQHLTRTQRGIGGAGGTLYTGTGVVTVQVFVPAGKQGLANGQRLGTVALNAYEGQSASGVWFRDVVCKQVATVGDWVQFNVTGKFTYDVAK